MNLYDENKKQIQVLERIMADIQIEELEIQISNKEADLEDLEKLVWKTCKLLYESRQHVLMLNNNVIQGKENLRNLCNDRLGFEFIPSIDVRYMDIPLNRANYLIRAFYREVEVKYGSRVVATIPLYSAGKMIAVEQLDVADKNQIAVLNTYLQLVQLENNIKILIDFIKCIQSETEVDDETV